MTNGSQGGKAIPVTRGGRKALPGSGKEERRGHSYAASAADSGQGQGQGHIEQVNSADSQQEISACFEAAIRKLDKIESDANKKKSEIIQELVRDQRGRCLQMR
jgi:hypothetical protein